MSARYRPLLRPAGFATLPSGLRWRYVEAPTMPGLYAGSEIPQSAWRYGVIETDRLLTDRERATYDLQAV